MRRRTIGGAKSRSPRETAFARADCKIASKRQYPRDSRSCRRPQLDVFPHPQAEPGHSELSHLFS